MYNGKICGSFEKIISMFHIFYVYVCLCLGVESIYLCKLIDIGVVG